MPIIVDRDAVREEIIMALQRCIERKPLMNISLRDIAAEAGMSHPKLLKYFSSKEELILSYVRYTRDYMCRKCEAWFAGHDRNGYGSNLEYMNAFMEYVANGAVGEQRPNATTHTYVLAHYNDEIRRLVMDEFARWRELMERCLKGIYGEKAGKEQAEAMMILIAGTFICNYNGVLTGNINGSVLSSLSVLAQS